MPQTIWSQDVFSKGELSPLMYSRITVQAYYNGLKEASNCITYPQGAIGKRFGTLYEATIPYLTDYRDAYFQSFQYLNECVYILIFIPTKVLIYLEGILIFTVTGTQYTSAEIRYIDSTVIENLFRISTGLGTFRPQDLNRTPLGANPIGMLSSTEISLGTPYISGLIVPTQFTTGASLPTTIPQIRVNQTYFLYTTSASSAEIYTTAEDAKARLNPYTIVSGGSSSNAVILNNWTLADVVFVHLPTYDFNDVDYDALTFTPGAVSGFNKTLTASGTGSAIFTSAYLGGSYTGNGGVCRIIAITSTTVVQVDIIENFPDMTGIPGRQSYLAKPAWNDTYGWPSKCSSFQNRACFANSNGLPNGLWLSVTNDYNDFDGLETDDPDAAISWLPTSDNVNYIRFIVPYRSLTIHTNTAIYSTPLSFETAITPATFSMTLQDSTPATAIQPRGIDNQIIILSGNDVHSMLWDGFNNSYTSNIASIANEQLIRSPHDEAAYVDLNKAGSRYMFIINDDGSMAIFQTLISEDVSGFTPATLNQSFGKAYFRWVTSSSDGRAWFLTERELSSGTSSYGITDLNDNALSIGVPYFLLDDTEFLYLSGDDADLLQNQEVFPVGIPSPFQFTTTDTLPTSSPQVEEGVIYWAVTNPELNFYVYLTEEDATAGINNITFSNIGVDSSVLAYTLETTFMLEELSFDVFTDCTYVYQGLPQSSFSDLPRFNAQEVKIDGDGDGFEYTGQDDTVKTIAHGALVDVRSAKIGFPIETRITPLQPAPPGALGAKSSTLVFPQHVRVGSFMFVDTKGGFINETPIQLRTLSEIKPGVVIPPETGVFEMSFMLGWNLENTSGITITHDDPFDIKLTGIFYRIES